MAPAASLSEGEMAKDSRWVADLGSVDERKQRIVHARFSARELAALSESAKAAEITVSAFLRSLALEGAGVRPFFTDNDRAILEVLISDMRALGTNLNQIARSVNAGRQLMPFDLAGTLTDVQRLVAAIVLEMKRFAGRGAQRRRGEG
jgi:hypothetical protein